MWVVLLLLCLGSTIKAAPVNSSSPLTVAQADVTGGTVTIGNGSDFQTDTRVQSSSTFQSEASDVETAALLDSTVGVQGGKVNSSVVLHSESSVRIGNETILSTLDSQTRLENGTTSVGLVFTTEKIQRAMDDEDEEDDEEASGDGIEPAWQCPQLRPCYVSPAACVEDCRAGVSITPTSNQTSEYEIFMVQQSASFVAVSIRNDSSDEQLVLICVPKVSKVFFARSKFNDPIIIDQSVEVEFHSAMVTTESIQCIFSAPIFPTLRTEEQYKVASGEFTDELKLSNEVQVDKAQSFLGGRLDDGFSSDAEHEEAEFVRQVEKQIIHSMRISGTIKNKQELQDHIVAVKAELDDAMRQLEGGDSTDAVKPATMPSSKTIVHEEHSPKDDVFEKFEKLAEIHKTEKKKNRDDSKKSEVEEEKKDEEEEEDEEIEKELEKQKKEQDSKKKKNEEDSAEDEEKTADKKEKKNDKKKERKEEKKDEEKDEESSEPEATTKKAKKEKKASEETPESDDEAEEQESPKKKKKKDSDDKDSEDEKIDSRVSQTSIQRAQFDKKKNEKEDRAAPIDDSQEDVVDSAGPRSMKPSKKQQAVDSEETDDEPDHAHSLTSYFSVIVCLLLGYRVL